MVFPESLEASIEIFIAKRVIIRVFEYQGALSDFFKVLRIFWARDR